MRRRISLCITKYLGGKGVVERKQATVVADITGLSVMHARRKLGGGPPWSLEEVMAIAARYGDTLDQMLITLGDVASPGTRECEIQIGAAWYAASAQLGDTADEAKLDDLVAVPAACRWQVMPYRLVPRKPGQTAYRVDSLQVHSAANANIRIAVLDDDVPLACSIRDSLTDVGFLAEAFGDTAMLQQQVDAFDVFIVDFFLGGNTTATSLIEFIRETKPDALILVLTGRAREAYGEEIARQIRVYRVQVHEKPAQMMYLESAIEAWIGSKERSHVQP